MDAPLRVAGFSGAARRVVHPLVYREIELYVHHRADREGECRRTAFRGYLRGRGRRDEPFRLPGLHEQDAAHSACGTQDPQSLQNALAPRFSDIKIISIGDIPEIDVPRNP